MLRTIFAVLTGYITTTTLVILSTTASLFLGVRAIFVLSLITIFPYSVAGGYVTARIAEGNERVAVRGLIALSVGVGIIALIRQPHVQPIWYSIASFVLISAGLVTGGYLRLRQTNKLVR